MVSAAAITMPRSEGALRGSFGDTFTGSTTRGPVEIVNEVTAAAMKAATGAAQDATLSGTMIQQFALQICIWAATAVFSQFAHAVCTMFAAHASCSCVGGAAIDRARLSAMRLA